MNITNEQFIAGTIAIAPVTVVLSTLIAEAGRINIHCVCIGEKRRRINVIHMYSQTCRHLDIVLPNP